MPTHIPRRRASQDESEIDLTPMLDVVFIMLIFFIVTASFVKEAGIHVARPQPQVEEAGKRNILLTVTAGNEIWLGERRIDKDFEELAGREQIPGHPAFIAKG